MTGTALSSIFHSNMGVKCNGLLDKWFATINWKDAYFDVTFGSKIHKDTNTIGYNFH